MSPRHIAVMAFLVALASPASGVPNYEFTVLHTFYNYTNPVSAPEGTDPTGFAMDAAGNLYGTNRAGGAAFDGSDVTSNGTLWMLPDGGGELVVLHSFTNGADGRRPSSLLVDANGDLYGTTQGDPNYMTPGRWGTIWRQPASSGAVNTIHTFDGNVDGANPWGIALDGDGILHVTTQYGSVPSGPGAVFRLNKFGGGVTSVEFTHGTTGTAGVYLTFDADGNAFGVSVAGGTGGHGTLFELPHASGALGALYAFADGDDGRRPRGRLAIDGEGNLFGVTLNGGEHGFGTIFELPNGATTVTTLYAFTGGADGRNPGAGVTIDGAGNLFGTTTAGGAHSLGTVFVLPRDASVVTTLHDLSVEDGVGPDAPLEIDADGNLFGTTTSGGTPGGAGSVARGTIFRLHPLASNELVFAQPPTNVAATAVISPPVVVHETDINGVIIPTFNGDVTLAIASGPPAATLGGTVTVAAANGIATFADLRIDLAGTYTLEATDGTLTATSQPFQVPEPDGAAAMASAALAIGALQRIRTRFTRRRRGNPLATDGGAAPALRSLQRS